MNKNEYFEELRKIREQYLKVKRRISHRPPEINSRTCMIDPYSIKGWFEILTPIEKNVWSDIRRIGLPFYPQYPIGKYFVDFADPVKKIVIECDGREWHQNIEKDLKRQGEIERMGWVVIRILGRETYKDFSELYNYTDNEVVEEERAEEIEQRLNNETSFGILNQLLGEYYSEDESQHNIDDRILPLKEAADYQINLIKNYEKEK